jgi:SanA protein
VLLVAGLCFAGAANVYVLSTTRGAIVRRIDAAPSRPYVIVLGNLVFPNGTPGHELAQRLEAARALYVSGRARWIVVSGVVRQGYDEPRGMAAWLLAHGVPSPDVILDRGGHRTAATMADAAALGVRSALVATQEYHLPRALYLARQAGIDAVGVAAADIGKSSTARFRVGLREFVARAEIVLEVALRGVRG